MNFQYQQSGKGAARKARAAFTLLEVVISLAILGTVLSGLIYGYGQANQTAEWSSMSLAAQASASRGAEQARAADWRPRDYPQTYGPGGSDEWTNGQVVINYDYLDVPVNGNLITITNIVSVTNVSINPPLRQITSQTIWTFPLNGTLCTNTVIQLRTSDQ
jgi:prepilin-type N-terminal cleavage/methylation domain-containing protein